MVGFYMVLFIAAIKGIPAEVYDAARVDGAGRFRTAISITVPMIRDTIRTAYIYLGILALFPAVRRRREVFSVATHGGKRFAVKLDVERLLVERQFVRVVTV